MASLTIADQILVIEVTGLDRILAVKHSIEIPLGHVAGIEQDVSEARAFYHGLRLPGTSIPGIVTAGSFYRSGEWTFWDVHDPAKAVIIRLHDEHYAKLVVGVDDPIETVQRVRNALGDLTPLS